MSVFNETNWNRFFRDKISLHLLIPIYLRFFMSGNSTSIKTLTTITGKSEQTTKKILNQLIKNNLIIQSRYSNQLAYFPSFELMKIIPDKDELLLIEFFEILFNFLQ